MGILKELGLITGTIIGGVIGGTVELVGKTTGSKFIEEIGQGVFYATSKVGELAGQAASGAWDMAAGVVTQDSTQFHEGINDLGGAVVTTAKGVGATVCNVYENTSSVITGFSQNNDDLISQGAKGLIKTAAIGVLAVGVIDFIDGVDSTTHLAEDIPDSAETTENVTLVENPNSHHVTPHWRELADGSRIWVDGDGDTSVNTYDGWNQQNPDFRTKG